MRRVLLVASTGGHLAELYQLRHDVAEGASDIVWATFSSQQSRTLLAGQSVVTLGEIEPRGYASLVRSLPRAMRTLATFRPDRVVSTGSGIALAFLPFAPLVGAEAVYVESAARVERPSLTGRLLSLLPWVNVFTQYPDQVSRRWRHRWSIFDHYDESTMRRTRAEQSAATVLVMLGTLDFDFSRLVDAVVAAAPPEASLVWQLGGTEPTPTLPGTWFGLVGDDQLRAIARDSSIIISHAGVGSALLALDAGVQPILVPRRHAHGEHVDDHQVEVARALARRGLALCVEAGDLDQELFDFDYRVGRAPTA